MKRRLFCTTLLAFISIMIACKKEGSNPSGEDEYIEGHTRVIGVRGVDTSSTKYISGRIETQALIIKEDDKLRAELISFTPLPGGNADYLIRITNRQPCQMILRWNWDNLNPIVSIEPDDSTAHTSQSDVLKPNQVKTYHFIARAIAGKIYVKAEKSNNDCPNSSTLVIEITNVILPISYTKFKRTREGDNVTVTWSTDAPQDVDQFLVLWTPTGKKEDEVCKYIQASDPNKKEYTVTYKANKKLK